jgi:hypothetical protein
MGLTLHYRLSSPSQPTSKVRSLLQSLRTHALSLPFLSVSNLIELEGEDCLFDPSNREAPHAWLNIQTTRFLMHEKGDVITAAGEFHPIHIIAFTVDPAEGSEQANFGLCRYPGSAGWSWSSFCKTQYASNPSTGDVANFLKCHLGLINLLDKARELKILGEVHDEGKYWQNRDVEALIKEVGMWNRMVAGLYGQVRDAVEKAGGDPAGLVAEIAKFKDFERLEAEGRRE